jgi:hypothetical protein
MAGRVVRADDRHRDTNERRLEELTARVETLEAALAELVEAWGVPEQWWYRSDFDALIEAARALLGEKA